MEPLNLLLVEDEESLASFIQSELQFEGYKTSWEADGESALETFLQKKRPIRFNFTGLDVTGIRRDYCGASYSQSK